MTAAASFSKTVENDLKAVALEKAKFELMGKGIKALWNPDDKSIGDCVEFGKTIGEALK